ncbi:MAG: rhomboid family intramembrane serine protease [Spirochaetales bacterium]|nr:MAG: rhomboid family intramembrane serine protease [Spirochaetales bacterium]
MKLRYNAPVSLTFTIIGAIVLLLNQFLLKSLIPTLFTAPGRGGFSLINPVDYLRLITHVIGHANWTHFMSNFSFILLLGPSLEEKYGSASILFMMFVTAVVTGILNTLLIPAGLLGASGIVFMMILLMSFTNIKSGEIPITFILVVLLFLVKEVVNAFQQNNVSEFAHIAGGILGSLFGFLRPEKKK